MRRRPQPPRPERDLAIRAAIQRDLAKRLNGYVLYQEANIMSDPEKHQYHISLVFLVTEEEAARLDKEK